MKQALITLTILLIWNIHLQGQNYNIEWFPMDDSRTNATVSDGGGDSPIDIRDIPKGEITKIKIDTSTTNIDSIAISYKSGDSIRKATFDRDKIPRNGTYFTITIMNNKIRWGLEGFTETLSYPYKLSIITRDSRTRELNIGSNQSPSSNRQTPNQNVNIFNNVKWNTPSQTSVDSLIANIDLEEKNAIMLIDCSSKPQSRSFLYRRGKRRKTAKQVRYLRRGDYLKVYLYNINKYKYNVEINDIQEDYTFGKDPNLSDFKSNTGAVAAGTGETNDETEAEAEEKIKQYASAVDSMNRFVVFSKNISTPSSGQLEENQQMILANLQAAELYSSEHAESLYAELPTERKETLKTKYEKARLFTATLRQVMNLSYTIESTLLPIQVQSYDQLKFTIKIKDEEGNTIGKEREYSYQIMGGIKVDQSFGIIGHGLFDQEYALKNQPFTDTTFATLNNGLPLLIQNDDGSFRDSVLTLTNTTKSEIIDEPSSSKISLGMATLTHFYYRLGFINVGPEIGFAVDIYPEQKVRYLAGGSIMFSDGRHRVALNMGLALGKVKELSKTHKVGDLLDGTDATVPLVEKNKRALYFGITYNVPITQKQTQLVNKEN